MHGRMIEFRANGRMTPGYLNTSAGRGPGLVVIQEWWGLVDHIKQLADRFAAEGFITLAPDLFHGKQTRSPDEAGKLLMALNIAEAGKDIRGAAQYLLALPEVEPKRVGVIGFCMGGQLALYAAQEFPDVIAAAVDFYGIHPKAAIDPAKLQVPVLAHFGRKDPSVKEADARALAERYAAAGKSFEAHFYDAGHAFFNDTRPEAYDAPSAELAWQRTLEFLRRHLSGTTPT
ncbi:MAG TPA: dienelactone hydrolase family protein [Gemmatimonadales bacterium]|jgi:carboxymethylenebutenolidase|nr:dienelactone hydrolase family protein [Gemmatimonadales bacterium]